MPRPARTSSFVVLPGTMLAKSVFLNARGGPPAPPVVSHATQARISGNAIKPRTMARMSWASESAGIEVNRHVGKRDHSVGIELDPERAAAAVRVLPRLPLLVSELAGAHRSTEGRTHFFLPGLPGTIFAKSDK